VGYARVSTDQLSGVRDDRPGDTVVVVALDRLGRSLSGVNWHRGDADRAGSAAAGRCGRGSTTPPRPGGCWPGSSPRWPATNGSWCTSGRPRPARPPGCVADTPADRPGWRPRRCASSARCAPTGSRSGSWGTASARATVYRALQQDPVAAEAEPAW